MNSLAEGKNGARVIIFAINVHQGGGAALLRELLAAPNGPDLAFLDSRMPLSPMMAQGQRIIRVLPNVLQRLKAEVALSRTCRPKDLILCFGNLPPILPCSGDVYVYIQNRYLIAPRPLTGFSLKARARICLERWWLRAFMRNSSVVVQTATMAQEVHDHLQRDCEILPFKAWSTTHDKHRVHLHDFIYVASGEPHKNHKCLVEAWDILAKKGLRPSLCLTLDESTDARLLSWIRNRQADNGLQITNHKSAPEDMASMYGQSRAAIYPSLFESFGLPLLEAKEAGLPVLASERDYVRDVIEPNITFDPSSPLSIARAVMRHLGCSERPACIPAAAEFWQQLRDFS